MKRYEAKLSVLAFVGVFDEVMSSVVPVRKKLEKKTCVFKRYHCLLRSHVNALSCTSKCATYILGTSRGFYQLDGNLPFKWPQACWLHQVALRL